MSLESRLRRLEGSRGRPGFAHGELRRAGEAAGHDS